MWGNENSFEKNKPKNKKISNIKNTSFTDKGSLNSADKPDYFNPNILSLMWVIILEMKLSYIIIFWGPVGRKF